MRLTQLLVLLIKGKKPRHSKTARLIHWIYVPAILACAFSGFYITRPARLYGFKNMDSARKTHFMAMFALAFSYIARVCYGFKNKNYKEIIPEWKTLTEMPKFLKHEFFLSNKQPQFPKYNPGQKMLFTGLVLFIPIQIMSGLSLYSSRWQKTAKLAGGLNHLRKLHFLTALAISSLSAGHLYFVLTHEPKKLKSIFTGYE